MAKKVKKRELGAGVHALLRKMDKAPATPEAQEKVVKELSNAVAMIPIGEIEVNPNQPRNEFDEDALNELAESLKIHGLIQPVTVRRMTDKQYQLISGERRWRASQKAGLPEIPAYIRIANDQEMMEMALVENIQRQDLNALEVAIAYERLIREFDLTHDSLSSRVGKKRSTVTNFLRLLNLPPDIQKGLKSRKVSMGHARALLALEDLVFQSALFHQIMEEDLSVRATEDLIRKYKEAKPGKSKPKDSLPDEYKTVQDNLCQFLGTKVKLKRNSKGVGQIVIPFTSDDDLNRLLDLIEE